MATKVFISWSGELSRLLAEALREWLPSALQYVKPYFSPEDIEKGTKWNTEIAKELELADIGIICLTHNNIKKPWILFEAGALSKSIDKSRVCTLLFDIEPADVKGPLTSFQSTRFQRDDFKRLITTINNSAEDAKLESGVLENVFDMWWPKLEEKVKNILSSNVEQEKEDRRSERDMLEEVLELTRMNAARLTRSPRISERAIMELVEILDEIMMIMRHFRNDEKSYYLLKKLDRPLRHICMEAGIPEMYEQHRMKMRSIVGRLRDEKRFIEMENEG